MDMPPPDASKEYIWCTQLSKTLKSTHWEGRDDGCVEQLVLKRACLGAGAKENERNLVQVTSFDHLQEKVQACICSLRAGGQEDVSLSDLTILPPAVFKLLEGSGPLHLVGNHMIMEDYEDEDSEADFEEKDMESEDISDEEEEDMKMSKNNGKQIKKGKEDSLIDDEASEEDIASDDTDEDMEEEEIPEPKSTSKKRKHSEVKAEIKTDAPEKKKKSVETPKKKETPKTPLQQKENKAPQGNKRTPSIGEVKSAKKDGARKKKTTSLTG